jgi:hypothetical protein
MPGIFNSPADKEQRSGAPVSVQFLQWWDFYDEDLQLVL